MHKADGNIFLALFGAVALAGLLFFSVSQFVRGPLTTSTNLTRSNTAKQQMGVAAQLVLATSATQTAGAGNGDCDSDNFIEPLEYRDGTTVPHPAGGGYLPNTVGALKKDPWGTEYGYCAWDAGSIITSDNNVTCGGTTAKRLDGAKTTLTHPTKPNTQAIIAVISAGKDKAFQTTCNAFVDLDDNAEADVTLVDKTVGSDDIIVQYTYNEAREAGGDLWTLKTADPGTATIAKNVEIAPGQSLDFGLGSRLLIPTSLELTDADCTGTSAGQVNDGALRLNITTIPPSLEVCYDTDVGGTYAWDWGSSGGSSVGSIDDLSDGIADYTTLFNLFLGETAGDSITTGNYNIAIGRDALTANTTGHSYIAIGDGALRSMNNAPWANGSIAIGRNALRSKGAGYPGIAIGLNAGYSNTSADDMIAIGENAQYLTNNHANVCMGKRCMYSTTGTHNIALGNYGLANNTSGSQNTAIGGGGDPGIIFGPMLFNTTGSLNTAVGTRALSENRAGSGSTAIGYAAMQYANSSTTAFTSYNTALGALALQGSSTASANTGIGNVAIGFAAMQNNTSGTYNIGIGTGNPTPTLMANNSGSNNVAIGSGDIYSCNGAMGANRSGSDNVAIGNCAMGYSWHKSRNVAVGTVALRNMDANGTASETYNTAVGWAAMMGSGDAYANTGTSNTAVGSMALRSHASGGNNTALGATALYTNSSGVNNTATGLQAMYSNTIGGNNVAVGVNSLYTNVAGSGSTAIGREAMRYANSSATAFTSYNTAVGYQALRGSTDPTWNYGISNVAIGYSALQSNTIGGRNVAIGAASSTIKAAMQDNTQGYFNTAIGHGALATNTYGSGSTAIGSGAMLYANSAGSAFDTYNTAVGTNALMGSATASANTGINNTVLGHSAGSTITSGSNNIMIGSQAAAPSATASNQLNIGNSLYGDISAHQLNLGSSTLVSGISLDVGSKTDSIRPAVGTTAQEPTCDSTRYGAMRFDTTRGSMMVCTSTGWNPLLMTSSGGGATSTPSPGTGYFVITYGTWTGNLGLFAGANSKCLSDLQTYNWKNKSDAVSRGILKASNVYAWICDGWGCQNAQPSTTYTFAASGYSSTGGATFMTNSGGQLPGNTENWSGTNYFGSARYIWSNRGSGTSTLSSGSYQWGGSGPSSQNCYSFTDGNGTYTAAAGYTNQTGGARWYWANPTCSNSYSLACLVNPGNESTNTSGYFVMTDTTYDGNLGGRSGANAKCLTELTTNTNWMGYSDANTRGLLNSTKVGAFICENNLCNNLLPSKQYAFALVGDDTIGGQTFTTDASSRGPSNTSNWALSGIFGGDYQWWANRETNTAAVFYESHAMTGTSACNGYSSNSAAHWSFYGLTNSINGGRWKYDGATCDQTKRLICYVNP